ncbi:hypothetical protein DFS33DRAFT_1269320 [Desarmillaria ectypa]|nr:hypothetical protein DFS33DRAFT_1269320 [Desarmillaria ectypa]
MPKKFTQDHLESLTRQELQALAKEHGIRANLGTKVIISNLLAASPATAKVEPKERPAKSNANKRKRGGTVEESSQAKKTPANAKNKKAPVPLPKRRRAAAESDKPSKVVAPPARVAHAAVQADELSLEDSPKAPAYGSMAEQLAQHAHRNGNRQQDLDEAYQLLSGMQKCLNEMQPEMAHHIHVRQVVEELLIVPMKRDRTLVDGSGFMPPNAAKRWRRWWHENIIYPETLHLKRTPEEQAAHRERKRQKKHHKRKEANADDSSDDGPGPSSCKPDYDAIQAELEEQRFRERMSMAFADDERLDSLEARFNDFAHFPKRWGGSSTRPVYDDDGDFMKLDPRYMDDEEYAEWIRAGMYRKAHAQEYEEARRRKAEKAARRAREKATKEESRRLERQAEEERRQRRRDRDVWRREHARQEYESRWKELLSLPPANLHFDDIPWPVMAPRSSVAVEDLTPEAVSLFLFSEEAKKERKDKLRETYLRFHPDKFESRLMKLVKADEQEKVRLGMGQVVRILNDLMKQGDG